MSCEQERKDLRRYVAWQRVSLPEALHPLLPFLVQFALKDEADRRTCIQRQPNGELRAFCTLWESRQSAVDAYLDSQGSDADRWGEIPFRFLLLCQAYREALELVSRNTKRN
jgi:hypothetical protein